MKKLMTALVSSAIVLSIFVAGCSTAAPPVTPEKAQELIKESKELLSSGKFDEANKNLEQVAKANQASANDLLLLGITRYQKKDFKGAREAYDKAIALDPKMVEPYQGKANTYRDEGNAKDAEVWYRKAIEVNPRFEGAYTELAVLMFSAGKVSEAIDLLKTGLQQNPNSLEMEFVLGMYYEHQGNVAEAQAAYERMLKIEPNNQAAKDALAALKK